MHDLCCTLTPADAEKSNDTLTAYRELLLANKTLEDRFASKTAEVGVALRTSIVTNGLLQYQPVNKIKTATQARQRAQEQ